MLTTSQTLNDPVEIINGFRDFALKYPEPFKQYTIGKYTLSELVDVAAFIDGPDQVNQWRSHGYFIPSNGNGYRERFRYSDRDAVMISAIASARAFGFELYMASAIAAYVAGHGHSVRGQKNLFKGGRVNKEVVVLLVRAGANQVFSKVEYLSLGVEYFKGMASEMLDE